MKFGKTLLVLVGATVLLGALVGTASATRLSSSSQTLRAAFRSVRFNGAFGNISCPVTVEGSFHQRTVAKTAGSLVGFITAANVGACEEGSATILRETLPWHIRYASFTGTLPNIMTIRANIIGVSFRIREPLVSCLSTSTAERPEIVTFNREAGGVVSTVSLAGTVPTSCGVEGTFSSTEDPVTVLGAAARITITLI